MRKHIELTPEQWGIHQYGDLHLNGRDAKTAGLVNDVRDFAPPKGAPLLRGIVRQGAHRHEPLHIELSTAGQLVEQRE